MTHTELRGKFPNYLVCGTGIFAVICHEAKRIRLFTTLEIARDAKWMNCGWGCDRAQFPHRTLILDTPPVEPIKIKTYRD
jgi:hypothetical protein